MNSILACEAVAPDGAVTDFVQTISQFAQFNLAPLANNVLQWLGSAILYGSVLAIVTWVLVQTVLRRARPAVHGALWLIVLLKFVVPFGPAWTYSIDTGITAMRQWWGPTAAAPAAPSSGLVTLSAIPHTVGADAPPTANAVASTASAAAISIDPLMIAALLYLAGVVITALIRVRAYLIYAARCNALPRADMATRETVYAICRRLGVRRLPEVRLSDDAPAPFLLGAMRPVLVLSRRQMADEAQLEAVVLHEIAHLRRGDLAVRYLQWFVGTCLFFWPVVAWVNRRIDLAREHICDEWALRHGRLSAGAYARTLLSAVSPAPRLASYAPTAMAAGRSHIERRIEMILTMRRASASVRSLGLVGGALVVAWGALTLTSAHAMAPKPCPPNESGEVFDIAMDSDVVVVTNGETEGAKITFQPDDSSALQTVHNTLLRWHNAAYNAVFGARTAGEDEPKPGAEQVRMEVSVLGVGGPDGQQNVLFLQQFTPSETTMSEVLSRNAQYDLDGDGKINTTEFNAFLTAMALSDPAAVLAKYPHADRNGDGLLDAGEAARLISSNGVPPMPPPLMNPFPDGVSIGDGQMRYTTKDGDTLEDISKRLYGDTGRASELLAANADTVSSPAELKSGMALKLPSGVRVNAERHNLNVLRARTPLRAGQPAEITLRSDDEAQGGGGVIRHKVQLAEPVARWLLSNINIDPQVANVRAAVAAVEDAPLAVFLEANPAADANKDGKLTPQERDDYMARHRLLMREHLLKMHPEADTDGDGVLSEDEARTWAKQNRANVRMLHGPGVFGAQPDGNVRVVIDRREVASNGETSVTVEAGPDASAPNP